MINSDAIVEQLPTQEETVTIDVLDPARELPKRELQEGIPPAIRSCNSCVHNKVCKIFEVQAIHTQRLEELAKRSKITLDILPPEEIGARCSEYSSGATK